MALERCGAAGDYCRGGGGKQARRKASSRCACTVPRRPSSRPATGLSRRSARKWNRRLGAVEQGAAALECCGAAGDYGRGLAGKQVRCAGRWADRGAAGQQPGSAAGARGSGAAGARARPNVEVNRRAEGTSELNRRLGDGEKGAVALERCGFAGDYGLDLAGRQERRKASSVCPSSVQMAKQQASNWEASPEHVEVDPQKPERGLTLRLTGVPKARPS